ncbi:hypothetical protein CANCADRAFT_45695 [Tortispora caseinolytica NRRL Y-17796]|uniref:Uncharacterized protein n=1 Tax=Tortispora caseinolytica NRRL Y-17796 TaxID=767744 RepID=A0A1E4TBW0_9ASCO|nr:hypothetical protein CANCADRAFT_45695 [Tortispora caseinolytica NRRL Y-17796]
MRTSTTTPDHPSIYIVFCSAMFKKYSKTDKQDKSAAKWAIGSIPSVMFGTPYPKGSRTGADLSAIPVARPSLDHSVLDDNEPRPIIKSALKYDSSNSSPSKSVRFERPTLDDDTVAQTNITDNIPSLVRSGLPDNFPGKLPSPVRAQSSQDTLRPAEAKQMASKLEEEGAFNSDSPLSRHSYMRPSFMPSSKGAMTEDANPAGYSDTYFEDSSYEELQQQQQVSNAWKSKFNDADRQRYEAQEKLRELEQAYNEVVNIANEESSRSHMLQAKFDDSMNKLESQTDMIESLKSSLAQLSHQVEVLNMHNESQASKESESPSASASIISELKNCHEIIRAQDAKLAEKEELIRQLETQKSTGKFKPTDIEENALVDMLIKSEHPTILKMKEEVKIARKAARQAKAQSNELRDAKRELIDAKEQTEKLQSEIVQLKSKFAKEKKETSELIDGYERTEKLLNLQLSEARRNIVDLEVRCSESQRAVSTKATTQLKLEVERLRSECEKKSRDNLELQELNNSLESRCRIKENQIADLEVDLSRMQTTCSNSRKEVELLERQLSNMSKVEESENFMRRSGVRVKARESSMHSHHSHGFGRGGVPFAEKPAMNANRRRPVSKESEISAGTLEDKENNFMIAS